MTITKEIANDSVQLCEKVVQYLVSKGHRHVVFITNDLKSEVFFTVLKKIKEIKKNEELLIIKFFILKNEETERYDIYFVKYLSENYLKSAIIVKNNDAALEILRICYELNIQIPNDISLIYFSKSFVSEIHHVYPIGPSNQNPYLNNDIIKSLSQ